MRYIYVYNENSRASEYGIGTYISQIICMLKDLSDTKLIIVESVPNAKNLRCFKKMAIVNIQFHAPMYLEIALRIIITEISVI